eukprot:1495922-Rhodomonas_salina.1
MAYGGAGMLAEAASGFKSRSTQMLRARDSRGRGGGERVSQAEAERRKEEITAGVLCCVPGRDLVRLVRTVSGGSSEERHAAAAAGTAIVLYPSYAESGTDLARMVVLSYGGMVRCGGMCDDAIWSTEMRCCAVPEIGRGGRSRGGSIPPTHVRCDVRY